MATVYSLVCWQGQTGVTVTFSGSPSYAVVNLAGHNINTGCGVSFTVSGGSLPTGLSAAPQAYYAGVINTGSFYLYDTATHAVAGGTTGRVAISSNGSGTVTAWSAFYQANIGNLSRWTSSVSTVYVYGGVGAWVTARNAATGGDAVGIYNTEVCEIADTFTEVTSGVNLNLACAATAVTSLVNGVRSAAFHNAVIGTASNPVGYTITPTNNIYQTILTTSSYYTTIDGISAYLNYGGTTGVYINSPGSIISNNILYANTGSSAITGIFLNSDLQQIYNNVILCCSAYGFKASAYVGTYGKVYNNIIAKCAGTGWYGNAAYGQFYNNIGIGNGTNWGYGPAGTANGTGAGYNFGVSGDTPWYIGTNTGIATLSTTNGVDFVSYTTDNYIPASTSSKQVDTGLNVYQGVQTDIRGHYRPDYIPTGYPASNIWCGGPFEFDHGFGENPPAIVTINFLNLAAGSTLTIDNAGTPILGNTSVSGTYSYPYTFAGAVTLTITLRNSGYIKWTQTLSLSGITQNTSTSVTATQLVDSVRLGSYPAGLSTDCTVVDNTSIQIRTNIYTLQDIYTYLCHYFDQDSKRLITLGMSAQTHYDFTAINGYTIDDTSHQYMKTGSITEAGGNTLWSNAKLATTGLVSGTQIYAYQGTSLLTSYWATGTLDILIKVKASGSLISSGLVYFFAREYSSLYTYYVADLSGGGSNTVPLSTSSDSNNQTSVGTVSAYSGITFTVGATTWDVGDGAGAQPYTATLNCNSYSLAQVYEYTKYLTERGSTATLNGVTGDKYTNLASFPAILTAPLGTFAGGKFFAAEGIKLTGLLTADALNFQATDNNGVKHNPPVPPVAITAPNLITGTRIQIYNVTTSTEIDNSVVTQPYSYSVTVGGGVVSLGDVIRMRACYCSGVTAKNDILNTAVITSAGCSFIDTQTTDTIYGALAIDGSAVTGFSFDGDDVTIDESGLTTTTKANLMAWYKFKLGDPADGTAIKYYFGAVSFLAANDFRVNTAVLNAHIKNTSGTSVLFTDTNVRLYRDDGTTLISGSSTGGVMLDYTGVPDVVTVSSGSGLSTAEHNQLMALPAASAVRAEMDSNSKGFKAIKSAVL